MVLTNIFTNELVLLRLEDAGNNKMALATVTGHIQGDLQIVDDDKSELADGVFGKTYVFYSDGNVTVNEGDVLQDSNGIKYTVKSGGVSIRQHGNMGFSKIIVEKTK